MQRIQKNKIRVAVVVGGSPKELNDAICTTHEVSKSLERLGNYVEIIIFDERFKKAIKCAKPNIAFIIDASFVGKSKTKHNLRKILERLNIPYTGSGLKASSITKNKSLSKEYFKRAGLLTPPCLKLNNQNFRSVNSLLTKNGISPPYVIKPRDEGSGIDICFIKTKGEIIKIADKLLRKHDNLIIEQYIDGIEVTIPVVEMENKTISLPIIEIEKSVKILSNDIKLLLQFSPQNEGERIIKYHIPARIEKKLTLEISRAAIAAHKTIGCRGYSRVDMIIDKYNNIYVIEINSLPTLSENGLFSKAAALNGITYDKIISSITSASLNQIN